MSNIQYINPETAAHNIATAFVQKHLMFLKDPELFNTDSPMYAKAVSMATQVYANAYDVAFCAILEENFKTDED